MRKGTIKFTCAKVHVQKAQLNINFRGSAKVQSNFYYNFNHILLTSVACVHRILWLKIGKNYFFFLLALSWISATRSSLVHQKITNDNSTFVLELGPQHEPPRDTHCAAHLEQGTAVPRLLNKSNLKLLDKIQKACARCRLNCSLHLGWAGERPACLWNQAAAALGTPSEPIPDKQVLIFFTAQYFLVLLFGSFVQLAH